jgi:hypothetical protein
MSFLSPVKQSLHQFHIPVMGTGFTNTTPLEVAPLGVTSVVSLVDDTLLEQQRKVLSQKFGVPYEAILPKEDDARARRIRAYLDLIADEVSRRFESLKASPFEPGSPITRYFEILPEGTLKEKWRSLTSISNAAERTALEAELREAIVPGQIEANIMTKLDSNITLTGAQKPQNQSDAVAALRGFAMSKLRSSIVFSAGMNQRLFAAAATFDDFYPDENGVLGKRICLKVSDYRSADIQGAMLARKGLWVSEYRIESGLNCGGHAFPTEGLLMGPILDDFIKNRENLTKKLYEIFAEALKAQGRPVPGAPPAVRVTFQGGIGNAREHQLLFSRYQVDGVGWGSPFLLCPEVISVDPQTLELLIEATSKEIVLSHSSPLGVPFWNLMTSAGEDARRARNATPKSGSSCPRGFLAYNSEFSEFPICTASRNYHDKLKAHVADAPADEAKKRLDVAFEKSCLCQDLAGSAQRRWGIDAKATPLVCPGPNTVNFTRQVTFDEMVGHIYGRNNVLPANTSRIHVCLREFELYIEYLETELAGTPAKGPQAKWLERFKKGLQGGVAHLKQLAAEGWIEDREGFLLTLSKLEKRLEGVIAAQMVSIAEPKTEPTEVVSKVGTAPIAATM